MPARHELSRPPPSPTFMRPPAGPCVAATEQQGHPPSFAAWSRSSFSVNGDRPVDRSQMDDLVPGIAGVIGMPGMPGMLGVPDRRPYRGSTTSWTSLGADADDPFTDNARSAMALPQQSLLLGEYNRLAEKRGLRPLLLEGDDIGEQDDLTEQDEQAGDRRNWFARTFGKPPAPTPRRSSRHSIGSRPEKGAKHKRNDSDPTSQPPAAAAPQSSKSDAMDTLKNQTLQTLVRTCGKSFLYLPGEYATRSLMLPTCFRAAAQYLVQNGPETRGVFRISGSMRVVNELYDYYCINLDDGEDIAATVRSPNLPFHIKAGVHDVGSMFKRLLAGLPGGILGHLRLFEAFVEIRKVEGQSSNEVLESGRTEPAQMRARLIALAIGSVPSPLERELICAVFGLLSLIGYAAETAEPSQSTQGSSLPHSEMMGYAALGIIFGPLLLGDLLDSYSPDGSSDSFLPASPSAGPTFQSTPSPRSKADKKRKSMASDKLSMPTLPSTLDKILLANDIAEMMITNWRAIVYEMTHVGIMRKESTLQNPQQQRAAQPPPRSLRPSRSETFTDHNMGAMVQQASQLYSSHLRKTRSASNTQSPNGTINTTQPPSSVTSQRPADMSFEEFAARKRLRNYASNMSMASDSTYGAIEPQPVKPLSPPAEDPFFVPGSKGASTRPGTAKLTKQRRVSGGLSAVFSSDKSASPTKDSPKMSRKAVRNLGDSHALASEGSDKNASPWNVSLSPAKVKGATMHQINDNVKTFGSPKKTTPTRLHQVNDAAYSCRSEPPGRVGIGGTPQSKTAALIAKIMNTKQQPAPTPVQKPKVMGDLSSHKDKAPKALIDAPKIPNSKSAAIERGSPIGRQNNRGNPGTPRSGGNWTRRNAPPAIGSENQPVESSANVTPTPKRPWKTEAASFPTNGRGSPRTNVTCGSGSPVSRIANGIDGLERQSPMLRSSRNGKPLVTPQRRQNGGLGTGLVKGGHIELSTTEEKPPRYAQEQYAIVQSASDISPLSEINNDARGLTRADSKSSNLSTRSKQASKMTKDNHLDNPPEAKSPAVGSSVKAMAAMFDTAAWKSSFETSPVSQTQAARPRTPKQGPGLSQYTSNTSPSKSTGFSTPLRSPGKPALGDSGKDDGCDTDYVSIQRMASERRRQRLTKSEGKTAPLGRVGRLAAKERRELTRSVDRNDASDVARRRPLGLVKGNDGLNDAQQSRQARGLEDMMPQSKELGSPASHTSGRNVKTKQASDNDSPLVRQGTSASSRSVEYRTVLSPGPKPVSKVPALSGSSAKELQRLLDSKTIECQSWKTRAEAAENRVAELELFLAGSDGDGVVLSNYGRLEDGSKLDPFVTVTDQSNRQSWAWQNLLPATDSIHLPQEKSEVSSVVREIDGRTPTPSHTASYLRRDSGMDDGNASESSTTTVVVRGRLVNKRLLPFSM